MKTEKADCTRVEMLFPYIYVLILHQRNDRVYFVICFSYTKRDRMH
jgi:hypothetical protein